LEYGLSLAPTASSLSDYFQHMLANVGIAFPTWLQTANLHGPHPQIDLFACIVTVAVALLVASGIRESAGVNGALVVVQILAMLVFIAAVAHAIRPSNLQPFTPFGYHGVLTSTALVFFAYIGFDTVTVASEEAKRPERDVPIGIILALALGAILYVALTLCTVGVMRFDRLSDGAAMLDALGSVSKSHALYWIVAVGGLAGNATVMLTSLLGQVRIFYVMARDRMLPPGVARIHHIFRTPARMTVLTGLIVAVFAAVLPLTDLLTLVNIGTLAAFAIVCAGVLVLRVVNPSATRPFRAPLLPLFSIAGAAACLYLVTGLQVATWIRYGIWFAVGIVVYALYGFRNSRLRVELVEP
jgi:APA family basic amino acid/polyamine antiporter